MNKNLEIEYLVGKKAKLNITYEPFSLQILNFLNDLSISLDNNFNNKNYPDLKALSFFCRKNNILSLKNKHHNKESTRFGLGLLFHITPSNIPTNFAYSLIFGLITGNSNVVKVPSKKFEEINIICEAFNKVLRKKKYNKIKNMIAVLRYESSNELVTKKYSLMCDARLIWGGDQTINDIKKFNTKPKNIDIPFSDRYSISLINSDKILKLSNSDLSNLVRNFYNDTYAVDQNACSSPHLILWSGKAKSQSKKRFWSQLNDSIKKRYTSPLISTVDNYSRLVKEIIKNKNIRSYKNFSKSLYVVTLKKIIPNLFLDKTKWGFFFECDIKNLDSLSHVTNKRLQTLTYFGYEKKFLQNYFSKRNFNGIDRIVPFGQALNINLIWDGYDLTKILSREIEIK
ncbi:hypothetical protein OAM70_02885 [Pelagibacteraceae bacterium]|nr:hypothetical protein [Pelagibacteraceae bacterium]